MNRVAAGLRLVLRLRSEDTRNGLPIIPASSHHTMSEEAIPSISAGVVGSRFVSQSDIDTARVRREEQWKAAYARFLRLFVYSPNTHARLSSGLAKNHHPHPKKTHTMVAAWQRCATISLSYSASSSPRYFFWLSRLETCRQSRESTHWSNAVTTRSHPLRRPLGSQTRGMGGEDETSEPIPRSRRG